MRGIESGLIVYKQELYELAKILDIEEFDTEAIVSALVLTLPWKRDQNMCFYSKIIL